ncbi:MAG: hotdog fold thioesterase [Nocardia sp.]|uniref:PaaI family thioesterase n=1 Tax=Nocardia sp. TaxID=1821 RepID=UPI0026235B68|nr:hotdog fold thioesterase [Nocardia sp.]MCU1647683.1 hotdog fold thioesterase [Nocardia sp.]
MTVEVPAIAAADPMARAAEVARFPNLGPEDRFGIRQIGHGPDRIAVEQRLPAGNAGELPIGWLGPLADFVTGRAVQSALVPDVGIRTLSLHLQVGARGLRGGQRLLASGEVVEIGPHSVLAAGRITEEAGALVAEVTGRFIIVPGSVQPVATEGSELTVPESDSLATQLGAEAAVGESGETRFVLRPAQWMANPYGIVHGGIPVALAGLALAEAATAAAGPVRTLGMDITFHRPGLLDNAPLTADAVVERAGQRVVSANAIVYQGSSKQPIARVACTMLRTGD